MSLRLGASSRGLADLAAGHRLRSAGPVHLRVATSVKALRGALSLTQAQLAARLGMSRTAFTELERGQRRIDVDELSRLAEALGVESVDLLNGITFDQLRKCRVADLRERLDALRRELKENTED